MSLSMMETDIHQVEDHSEAADNLRDQLLQHLIDMSELCAQVRSDSEADESEDEELADVYAELMDALEQHNEMISALSDASGFELTPEAATCSR